MKSSDNALQCLLGCVAGLLASCASQAPPSALVQAAEGSAIGYDSVQGAFEALQGKPGTRLTKRGGWTLIEDKEARTMWTFAAEDHPAYPAVAKTTLSVREGRAWVDLRIKCEASKEQCDAFADDMKARTGKAVQRTIEQSGEPGQRGS